MELNSSETVNQLCKLSTLTTRVLLYTCLDITHELVGPHEENALSPKILKTAPGNGLPKDCLTLGNHLISKILMVKH